VDEILEGLQAVTERIKMTRMQQRKIQRGHKKRKKVEADEEETKALQHIGGIIRGNIAKAGMLFSDIESPDGELEFGTWSPISMDDPTSYGMGVYASTSADDATRMSDVGIQGDESVVTGSADLNFSGNRGKKPQILVSLYYDTSIEQGDGDVELDGDESWDVDAIIPVNRVMKARSLQDLRKILAPLMRKAKGTPEVIWYDWENAAQRPDYDDSDAKYDAWKDEGKPGGLAGLRGGYRRY